VLSAAAWHHLQRVWSIPLLSGGVWGWRCWQCTVHFLSLVTLTFKLVWARDQTCLPCEFGANPFSHSWDIWFTNKQKTALKTERYLRAVTKPTNRQSCCNFWIIQLFHELRKNTSNANKNIFLNHAVKMESVANRYCWGNLIKLYSWKTNFIMSSLYYDKINTARTKCISNCFLHNYK